MRIRDEKNAATQALNNSRRASSGPTPEAGAAASDAQKDPDGIRALFMKIRGERDSARVEPSLSGSPAVDPAFADPEGFKDIKNMFMKVRGEVARESEQREKPRDRDRDRDRDRRRKDKEKGVV